MLVSSYQELIVWKKSVDLVEKIYRLTDRFPRSETYGLVSQMRRAAVSIPSNIAEGYRRNSQSEYIQFLHIASGSAGELETQIVICERLRIIGAEFLEIKSLLTEVTKMLTVMISKLKMLRSTPSPLHPKP